MWAHLLAEDLEKIRFIDSVPLSSTVKYRSLGEKLHGVIRHVWTAGAAKHGGQALAWGFTAPAWRWQLLLLPRRFVRRLRHIGLIR